MKRLFVLFAFFTFAANSYSQKVVKEPDGNFKQVPSPKKDSASAKAAGKVFTDLKGVKHMVFITAKGRYFIYKKSNTTGKVYRYYLKLD